MRFPKRLHQPGKVDVPSEPKKAEAVKPGKTVQDYEKSLLGRTYTPSFHVTDIVSRENLRRLEDLMKTPEIITLEAMYLAGEIKPEDLRSFAYALPEFHTLCRELEKLAVKIVHDMEPKLPEYLDRGSFGLQKLFQYLGEFHKTFLIKNKKTLRNVRLMVFAETILQSLVIALGYVALKSHDPERQTVAIEDFMIGLNDRVIEKTGRPHPCFAFMEAANTTAAVLRHEENTSRLLSLISSSGDTPTSATLLQKFEEIRDLSAFYTVDLVAVPIDKHVAVVIGPPLHPARELCSVVLKLGDDQNNPLSYLPITLDASTGDLCLFQTTISLSRSLFSFKITDEQYRELKHKVFDILLMHLQDREKEGRVHLRTAREEREWQAALDEEEKLSQQKEDTTEVAIPSGPQDLPEIVPEAAPDSIARATHDLVEENVATDNEKEEAYQAWKRLRGISSNRIMRILVSLLGKPIRRSGSHCIFYSERTKITHLFADHGAKPIVLDLLRLQLKAWGITPQEIVDRL